MTDAEIIKALECCIKETSDCGNCPLYVPADADCINISKAGALYLINRQKSENSNLTSHLTSLQNDLTSANEEIERLQNEIRFLHANDMTIAEKVKEQAKGL